MPYLILVKTEGTGSYTPSYREIGLDGPTGIFPGDSLAVHNGSILATNNTTSDAVYGQEDAVAFNANAATGALAWQRMYGSSNYETFYGATFDDYGNNAYLCGVSYDGQNRAVLLKINVSTGSVVWERTFDSNVHVSFGSLDTDSLGNIYAVGAYNTSMLMVKVEPNGNVAWVKSLGGSGYQSAYCVRVGVDGYVYVTGRDQATNKSVLVKISSSGLLQHKKVFGATQPFAHQAENFVLDTSNNIYTSGRTNTTGQEGTVIFKANSSGTLLWQKKITVAGDGSFTRPAYLAIAPDTGNVWVVLTTRLIEMSPTTGDVLNQYEKSSYGRLFVIDGNNFYMKGNNVLVIERDHISDILQPATDITVSTPSFTLIDDTAFSYSNPSYSVVSVPISNTASGITEINNVVNV